MKDISPIMVTNHEFIADFDEIIRLTPWWKKYLFSKYDMPEGFPHMEIFKRKIPAVHYALCKMDIDNQAIILKSGNFIIPNITYRNLDESFEIHVPLDRITRIDRFIYVNPLMKFVHVNMIQIESEDLDIPLLISKVHFGTGSFNQTNKQTDRLLADMKKYIDVNMD